MRQRAMHHKKTSSIGMRQRAVHRKKTAEVRFHTLARGWLAYPVTPTQGTGTRTIGMRQRRITPRNPIRTKRQRRAHGASAGTIYMRFGDALLRRPRKRSRLQLTPDSVGGMRTTPLRRGAPPMTHSCSTSIAAPPCHSLPPPPLTTPTALY